MKAMQGSFLFRLTRVQRREIGVFAFQLGIPGGRLREHFDKIRASGVGYKDLGDRMVQDLTEMRQLAQATNPIPAGLRKNLAERPLEQVLNEMREHAQAMQQAQQAKAA